MKKSTWVALGVSLALSLVVAREWLVHEEINSLRTSTLDQIREHILNAQTASRLRELQSSATVFDRYLEPVLLSSSRLIWSPSRAELITEWRRQVHTQLNERILARGLELETQLKTSLTTVRSNATPSLKRLFDVIKESENHDENMSCSETVKEEIEAIQLTASERDQEAVKALRAEGTLKLSELKKALKSKSPQQVAQFLTSGRYYNDIEKPVLSIVLQIKQEELRKTAWTEFRRKIDETLSEKRMNIAKSLDTQPKIAAKSIEKISDPVSQALRLDQYFDSEEARAPSDSGSITDEDPTSPSDSQVP